MIAKTTLFAISMAVTRKNETCVVLMRNLLRNSYTQNIGDIVQCGIEIPSELEIFYSKKKKGKDQTLFRIYA